MAYIGKAPNTAIVNQATSQSFSGNGSTTAFTLTRSVNVGEDLEVFVNNVQQEPGSGKSYTASGTTLTFDEAPPSGTNNVYVIYRGEATINPRLEHDANAALAATTGTFSDAVTVANGLTVDDDGATALTEDRASSEGTVVDLQKDGTTFGTLGIDGSDLVIDGPSGHTGLRMTTSGLLPRQNGAIIDNTIDLGSGAYRYNDLYLGGGLYVGGTGSANHLDDYEEGTFTPACGGSGTTYNAQTGRYVKIGRLVYFSFDIRINAIGSGTTNHFGGLPFGAATESAISIENISNIAVDVTFINFRVAGTAIYAYFTNATGTWNTLTANPHFLRDNVVLQGSGTYETSS